MSGKRQNGGARTAATVAAAVVFGVLGFFALGATALALGAAGLPALVLLLGLGVVTFGRARRHSSASVLATTAAAILAVPATLFVSTAVAERRACGAAERRALTQVPHPGAVRPGVAGDLQTGGCIVRAFHSMAASDKVNSAPLRSATSRTWARRL